MRCDANYKSLAILARFFPCSGIHTQNVGTWLSLCFSEALYCVLFFSLSNWRWWSVSLKQRKNLFGGKQQGNLIISGSNDYSDLEFLGFHVLFFPLIHYLTANNRGVWSSAGGKIIQYVHVGYCVSECSFFPLTHYSASNNRVIWLSAGVKIIRYASGIFLSIYSKKVPLHYLAANNRGIWLLAGVKIIRYASGILSLAFLSTGTRTHIHTHIHVHACTRNTAYDESTRNMCCSVLQCVAVCCSVLLQCIAVYCSLFIWRVYMQHVLQCVAVCCSVLQVVHITSLQHTATHSNTQQHTATHSSTPQHTATHSSTQQHTATKINESRYGSYTHTHTHTLVHAHSLTLTHTRTHIYTHTWV